ncbi:hypothetical protein M569_01924, partial [Genlisea aurea]
SDFNLYELLGVDSSSEKAQIKEAYRALQKRCHPDVAGPSGHDMAIVLNEAYALLSDERTRTAYDKELAKFADLQGYTGRPLYSVWNGSDDEGRAVFVDEGKCVGCLKCALFAEKTFAIESVYGRARVVAQWADSEHKIQEAIGSCPVDCISIVDRSNLPALEFIMSKQPRGNVRVGASDAAGARTPDVFNELEKFQARYASSKVGCFSLSKSDEKTPSHQPIFSFLLQDSLGQRASAIHAIRSMTNWLYWQSPHHPAAVQNPPHHQPPQKPCLKKLKAAAQVRKQKSPFSSSSSHAANEYYWRLPTTPHLQQTETSHISTPESSSETPVDDPKPAANNNITHKADSKWRGVVPTASAVVAAAAIVRIQSESSVEPVSHVVKYHVGGPLALAVVNSPWLQVGLAGITWFLIGTYVVEL